MQAIDLPREHSAGVNVRMFRQPILADRHFVADILDVEKLAHRRPESLLPRDEIVFDAAKEESAEQY
jgi:hypothetical protein